MDTTTSSLTAKDAARIAINYVHDLLPETVAFMLEEVEKQDANSGALWNITISFNVPDRSKGSILPFAPPSREFKSVLVNAKTGEVESMKIRKV